MDAITAIHGRRSIRKYEDRPIPRDLIEQILQAGIAAPSAKNRQPWRFVVVTEKARDAMAAAMLAGIEYMEAHGSDERGARHTLRIMEQAPVTVFILNPEGKGPEEPLAPYDERFPEIANVQSVGAAIQNMCLAATALGLGSLWICDVFSAYHPLCEWLGTKEQLTAAVSFGYPAEHPAARPRNALADITTWR